MSHDVEVDEIKPYALVAEFDTADDLIEAANAVREAGYTHVDAYTPFPVHGLSEAIGFKDQRIPWFIFCGGMLGALAGYTLQWYTAVIDYPLNVGGKPLNSLPAFFPVTFECTILFSALTAVFGTFALCGLPKPYHSIFNTPNFDRATQDRFFLEVGVSDPKFSFTGTRELLEAQPALAVNEVLA